MEKANQERLFTQTNEIMGLLRQWHNVLISGPPACGKSFLLSQIAMDFNGSSGPDYQPDRSIPLPSQSVETSFSLPSPDRKDRKVFRTTFDQNTKQSEFLRGLVPVVGTGEHRFGLSFRVSEGIFYEAAEHARSRDGAALLIIDELNRGPAVATFGSSIASLESDKRLDDNNQLSSRTQTFRILNDEGIECDYALSPHLYILTAMNQADTSVEPLDVAFLRRFASYPILPETEPLLIHFGISPQELEAKVDLEDDSRDLCIPLIRAWRSVNARISLVRGSHYQIGHGVLMSASAPDNPASAFEYCKQAWKQIQQHLQEVFFGDEAMIAAILAADSPGSYFHLNRTSFYGQPIARLEERAFGNISSLQEMLQAVAAGSEL